MKLILTQEVTGLGAAGDIVEVKDGYGRNFLIPRGFAIGWTKGGERTVESIKAARSSREVRDLDHAKQIKAQLESTTISVPVRAGEGGRLFGAVTVSDIAGAINRADRVDEGRRGQAQDLGRQPDQVPGLAPGDREGARRDRRDGHAGRRPRMSFVPLHLEAVPPHVGRPRAVSATRRDLRRPLVWVAFPGSHLATAAPVGRMCFP